MSNILVLSSARSRLSSSSSSTSTTSSAITAVRRTIVAATCSKHKTTAAAQNALYYNLLDHQKKTASSFSTTTTVSPTSYDGCLALARSNKQQQLHHQDVVMKADLMMSHTKRQQRITQQQQEQSQRDAHRLSSLLFTSSNAIDNIDAGINSGDNDNNNNNNNKNHFSRPPLASLLRFCEFNQHLPSSFLSSKLSHCHQYQHQHHLSSSSCSSLSLSSSMTTLTIPALSSPLRLCSSSSSSSSASSPPSSESSNNGRNNNDNDKDDINNNTNNNDKIDVTSFADSAKKILQDQEIAPLICTKTVGDVLPSNYFDEENLVTNEKLFTEQTYKSNLPVIAKIDATPAAAILSSPTAPDLNLTEQQFEIISHFVATIQFHPTMRKFKKDDDFSLAAKLNDLRIITVYDWYMSVAEARQELQPSQVELVNRRCAASFRKANEENKRQEQLDAAAKQEQIRTSTRNLAEKVSVDPALLPGKSHRHTRPFGFGVLARDTALSLLKDAVEQFKRDAKKEDLPLLIIRSMPRQGKTRLGDELGHRKDFYKWLNSKSADAENTFIFNLTFNTNWEVKQLDQAYVSAAAIKASEKNQQSNIQRAIDHRVAEEEKKKQSIKGSKDVSVINSDEIRKQVEEQFKVKDEDDKKLLVRVEKELCRRVVAAAVGVFTYGRYQKSDLRLFCEDFIEAHDFDFRKVCVQVQHLVATKGNIKTSEANFVFVFDEITNLEEKLNGKTALKAHFYSSIASLIDSQCAVLLSGFSEAKEALSMSGRNLETIILSPISSVDLRRELHTMKTKFFNLCAVKQPIGKLASSSSSSSSDAAAKERKSKKHRDAIFFYELVKSAPGLFGTLLEYLRIAPSSPLEKQIFLKRIPAIRTLRNNDPDGTIADAMLRILQLKSLLHFSASSADQTNDVTFSNKCGAIIFNTLQSALRAKVVDAAVSSDSVGDAIEDLYNSRLEPLFVHYARGALGEHALLKQYWDMLRKFSRIAANCRTVRRNDGEFVPLVNENDRKSVLSNFSRAPKKEKRCNDALKSLEVGNDLNSNELKVVDMEFATMRGFFFEDAIATGLLLQRQLRRALMDRAVNEDATDFSIHDSKQPQQQKSFKDVERDPSTSLQQYLDGSEVVCRIYGSERRETTNTTLRGKVDQTLPNGRILWSSKPSSSSSSSSPANIIEFEGHFPCRPHKNLNEQQQHTRYKKKPNNVTKEQCDSLDHVLRPRRIDLDGDPENNPLVDVIFNESFRDTDRLPDRDELVQFWIDGKHRQDFRDDSSLHYANLHLGLQEIADRIEKDCSEIRHIVHIIICPFRQNNDKHNKHVQILRSGIINNISLPAPLQSYTLCFVSPDDLSENKAFENLVSQPIALTVPLIEQQMNDSWTHSLHPPHQWWNYNATGGCRSRVSDRRKKRKGFTLDQKQEENLLHKWCPVASRMSIPGDFKQWRSIRFNGDCAVGIGHLFKTEKMASDKLSFEGAVKNQPHRSLEIPFGCILEALGILPPRTHGTSYCEYDAEDFRFKLRLVKSASSSSSVRFEISIIGQEPTEQHPALYSVTVKSKCLLDQIRVGHILRFDYSDDTRVKHEIDYQEFEQTDNIQQKVVTLSDSWEKKFTEYHNEMKGLPKLSDEDKKTILTCSDLWNMSLSEFSQLMFDSVTDQRFFYKRYLAPLLDANQNTGFTKDVSKKNKVVRELATFVRGKIEDFEFVSRKK